MAELYDPREWEDDYEETPPRAVFYDAEPDTRERGPKQPAPRGGYRIRSDETWAKARDAYLAGETAEEVAFRFDLTLGSLRHRARQEGWRRADQDDPEWGYRSARPQDRSLIDPTTGTASLLEPGSPPGDEHRLDDRWGHIGDDEGYAALAERALSQLRRAMAQGRAGAAASWMRVHDRLTARAELDEARQRKAAELDEARQQKAAEAARRLAEQAAAEAMKLAGAAAARHAQAADGLVRDVTTLALAAAAPGSGGAVSQAALEAELARLQRASAALDAPPISHDSDGSHPVSETEGDP